MRLFWLIYEEFFYYMECKASVLWDIFHKDRASYWLDFLPSFCTRERYRGQNKRVRLELKKLREVKYVSK